MARQSEFNQGAAHARDNIIATIIGLQNSETNMESERYKAWQELEELIIERYGDMMSPYKG